MAQLVKISSWNVGDVGLIQGWEEPLEKGKATHTSILGLENSMDYIVQGVTKSHTRLSNFHLVLPKNILCNIIK